MGEVSGSVGIVFVTVGTTRFDALVRGMLSGECLGALRALGATRLVIQHGGGPAPVASDEARCAAQGVILEAFDYTTADDIQVRLQSAGLVVSHGGAGSLLEALALDRRLVAVVNRALMDDHQRELADALCAGRHLLAAETEAESLAEAMKKAAHWKFSKWEARNQGVMRGVLAQELATL